MSFRTDIEEMAIGIAKRFDHGELHELHILASLRKILGSELEGLEISEIEELIKQQKINSSGRISITQESQSILEKIGSRQDGIIAAKELTKKYFNKNLSDEGSGHSSGITDPNAESLDSLPDRLSLQSLLAELNSLVGLGEVKKSVKRLINTHEANVVRSGQGLASISVGLHCVFTGSPGTGKTTVARSIAAMYCAIGLLPTNKVIEVDRSQLVAGFVGQTALKVQEVISQAIGGVLFIDEAYALSADSGAGFGDEAISTLVKAMEDNRGNLAIIVAGYKDPMQRFIESNQGLRSRFQNYIDFPDYTAEELSQIFLNLCKNHDMSINELGKEKLDQYLSIMKPSGDLGNARFVRNLFEKMYSSLSDRAAEDGIISVDELKEFSDLDIPEPEKKKGRIGFNSESNH